MQIQAPPVPMYGRRQRRHWSRRQGCLVLLFVAGLLLLCSCTASLALYVVFAPPTNLLVMGLDSRGGEGTTTRTDSIIVVGVNPRRLDVSLLSIPRDVFINVPGYSSPQRINTINVLAEVEEAGTGPILLAESIETSFAIDIDNYVRLDFQGFTELVDSIGGVTIDVPYVIVDNAFPTPDYGTMAVRFEQGRQHMDGERALIYARTRHQDDDYRRAERQQQVVTAIARKMLNPANWAPAWIAIQSNMDTNLSIIDLVRITPSLMFSGGNLNQLVVNRDYVVGGGEGYVIPNYAALRPYLEDNFR